MADPASLFSVIAGSAGLAIQCSKMIQDLHDAADQYKNADLTIESMNAGLETINWAWRRIQSILETWSENVGQDVDADTLEQLDRSLRGGRMVTSALEKDLQAFARMPIAKGDKLAKRSGFNNRLKLVWSERALRDHRERVRDQVNSMNLLVNVLKLPDSTVRKQVLHEKVDILRKSDQSAYTIVPSRFSRSDIGSLLSRHSDKPLVYQELSIDNDLFSARVYKRNYRNQKFQKLWHNAKQVSPTTPSQFDAVDLQGQPALNISVATSKEFRVSKLRGIVLPSPKICTVPRSLPHAKRADTRWVFTDWIVGEKGSDCVEGPAIPHDFATSIMGTVSTGVRCRVNLSSAIEFTDTDLFFGRLLMEGAAITQQWLQHCFMTACIKGAKDLVRLLMRNVHGMASTLDNSYDTNGLPLYGYTSPVETAYNRGHMSIVTLLKREARMMSYTNRLAPALIKAAVWSGDAELLHHVTTRTSNLYRRDDLGRLPIHLVCQHGSLECLGVVLQEGALFQAGAGIHAKDAHGISALQYLSYNLPLRLLVANPLPSTRAEREQAVKDSLVQRQECIIPPHKPTYHWAYRKAIRVIAHEVIPRLHTLHRSGQLSSTDWGDPTLNAAEETPGSG